MNIATRIKNFASNVSLLTNVSLRGTLKDTNWFKENFTGWADAFGSNGTVSKRNAIKITAVYTCLNILGETFGSLPFDVKQDTAKGRVSRKDHPVYKLIHDRPNPYTNAFDFWSTQVKLIRGWGNAYALIQRDLNATPAALWILHPSDVDIIKSKGQIFYKIKSTGEIKPHTELLHFKNFSLDGINGLSAIDENRATVAHAKNLKDYNSNIIGNRPPGYLTAPAPPKDTNQKDNIRKMLTAGVEKVGDIPLLYGGVEFKTFTLPADAVAYIESADLTESEIYGIFRIPPTLAQNYKRATFSNAEQQDLVFSKYSLAMRTGIEQECNAKLFSEDNYASGEPLYCKFNVKGLLAGDIKTRKEFYQTMVTLGIFSQNNVLDLEDMERFEGGDRRYIQGAMVPLDLIDDFIKKGGKVDPPKPDPEPRNLLTEQKRTELRAILNGHYKDVIDILES